MSNEFMREERYIVFKMPDLGNSLKGDEICKLAREYAEHLAQLGKKPLDYVVVWADWSEYGPELRAIEVHVNGAQTAPIEQDTSVRKAWARFSNELHRSSDAPYPGMSDAFEQHFSQSFTDREWRAESATWAAAWKAAKRHEAQAQPAQKAVAYLDLGVGGYMDIGTDLTDEALAAFPKGRHMLGIVGTYGVDGYVPTQPAPSVPTALLVAVADLCAQMEIVSRVGFVDTPNDKDSCAAFCVAEGTWLELMSAVESLASALAAAPEAKP